MEQQAKYGALPEDRSKTAQGNPGTRDPKDSRDAETRRTPEARKDNS